MRGTGHGADSGVPLLDSQWGSRTRIRDGLCAWWRNCPTEAEALAALGWESAG